VTSGVLVDACAIIAFTSDSDSLSHEGYEIMSEAPCLVSPMTVWEITRKVGLGKLPALPPEPSRDLIGWLTARRYEPAPLDWRIAQAAASLPNHHRDPMDRILIATARALGVPIVTCDAIFRAYGVETIW